MVKCIAGMQVAFSERVLSLLNGFRQREPHADEAGGILLGQYAQQSQRAAYGRTVLVTKASVPTSRDASSRRSFFRNAETAQIIVEHEHYNSAGRITYLGEWHTHPEPFAEPSSRDRRMIARAFMENDLNTDFLLLAR
jgi:integrative and conjugative element protein (TIGR02256 family)